VADMMTSSTSSLVPASEQCPIGRDHRLGAETATGADLARREIIVR